MFDGVPFYNHILPLSEAEEASDEVRSLVQKVRPNWPMSGIDVEQFKNGITNKIFCVTYGNEKLVLRIYGHGTEKLINRDTELKNFVTLSNAGIGPCIYARFCNGIICGYLPGECLTIETIRLPCIVKKISEKMAKMHRIKVLSPTENYGDMCERTILFSKINEWLNVFCLHFEHAEKQAKFDSYFDGIDLKRDFERTKKTILKFRAPLVFSHNDLNIYNILYDEKSDSVNFIDYEYAGINFQFFDIANHFCEYAGVLDPDYGRCPKDDEIGTFLHSYFYHFNMHDSKDGESNATANQIDAEFMGDKNDYIRQIHIFEASSHLFVSIWALVQSQNSILDFDYLGYAIMRHKQFVSIMGTE